MARVVKPNTGRAVLLTQDKTSMFKVSQMSFEGNKNKLGRVLTEWHDGFTNAKKYFNTKFF